MIGVIFMKRIGWILIVCFLLSSLSACGIVSDDGTERSPTFPLPEANFNNDYWIRPDFWAFDGILFYEKDGFYNMGVYQFANNTHKKLFQESDFPGNAQLGETFPCGNALYFDIANEQGCTLYRYDLELGKYTEVCQMSSVYRWAIAGDYLLYRVFPLKSSALYVYNMVDGTTTQVCDAVIEFGLVGGTLRYITGEEDYALYQYDYAGRQSTCLGTFPCKIGDAYDKFNFTSDGLVMLQRDAENKNLFAVYSIPTNSTTVYTLPRDIQCFVAYDQYAFAIVYDVHDFFLLSDAKNGIYRIRLSDGSYEIVEKEANNDTEIHASSDDCFYIKQRTDTMLSLTRRHIYQYHCTTGNKEKLTVY